MHNALKVITKESLKNPKMKSLLMTELKIHRGIKHKNICQFENYFEDNLNIYLVLELCPN